MYLIFYSVKKRNRSYCYFFTWWKN